jgi:hypothetical protein
MPNLDIEGAHGLPAPAMRAVDHPSVAPGADEPEKELVPA